jgi:hypothetical protein
MRGRSGGHPWLLLCLRLAVALPCSAAAWQPRLDLTLGTDYRRGELDWNIAGDVFGANPNVQSQLRWYDLESPQVNAALHAELDRVVVEAKGAYGGITDGSNQDSDYLADDRQLEFSRSDNKSGGELAEGSLGVGYRLRFYDKATDHYTAIIPMLGYSLNRQNLQIRDGVQTIPATGPFTGLDSRYDAEWRGPWLGVALQMAAGPRTALVLAMDYHWAQYKAEANWNLRKDLAHPVSFRHDGYGTGIVAALTLSHDLTRHWSVIARLEAEHWRANAGRDTLYTVDPDTGEQQTLVTRLNAVEWQSRAAGLAVRYRF